MDDSDLRQKRFDAQLPATVVTKALKSRLLRFVQTQKNAGYTVNQSEVIRMALTQFLDGRGSTVHLSPTLKAELEGYARAHEMTLEQAAQHALQWFLNVQRGK